ncbi:MAG: hypothetical protein J0H68_03385 [Sphingobacteriia bacterium]|nr:hypothetical protein [Sphingobacteriia bacterium]
MSKRKAENDAIDKPSPKKRKLDSTPRTPYLHDELLFKVFSYTDSKDIISLIKTTKYFFNKIVKFTDKDNFSITSPFFPIYLKFVILVYNNPNYKEHLSNKFFNEIKLLSIENLIEPIIISITKNPKDFSSVLNNIESNTLIKKTDIISLLIGDINFLKTMKKFKANFSFESSLFPIYLNFASAVEGNQRYCELFKNKRLHSYILSMTSPTLFKHLLVSLIIASSETLKNVSIHLDKKIIFQLTKYLAEYDPIICYNLIKSLNALHLFSDLTFLKIFIESAKHSEQISLDKIKTLVKCNIYFPTDSDSLENFTREIRNYLLDQRDKAEEFLINLENASNLETVFELIKLLRIETEEERFIQFSTNFLFNSGENFNVNYVISFLFKNRNLTDEEKNQSIIKLIEDGHNFSDFEIMVFDHENPDNEPYRVNFFTYICFTGNRELFRAIINKIDKSLYVNAFFVAIKENHIKIVEAFLENSINPRLCSNKGESLLDYARKKERHEIVQLIENKIKELDENYAKTYLSKRGQLEQENKLTKCPNLC